MGIYFFAITYGLMESANAVYVYSGNRNDKRNLFIISSWGLLIVLCSLSEIFYVSIFIKNIIYILFGFSWFLLISAPCTLKLFRKNKTMLFIRKLIFILLGSIQFVIVAIKYL